LRPVKPRNAGSRVTAAIIVTSTVTDVAMATPVISRCPMTTRPSNAITTVVPANSTARPAVVMALTVAL